MQRDFLENNRKGSRLYQADNSAEGREKYGNDLKDQIKSRQDTLNSLKKENEMYQKLSEQTDVEENEKIKQEILDRKNVQLQYKNDLRMQLTENALRKKEEKRNQAASNCFDYGYIDIGSNRNEIIKKQQNIEYKKGLDAQMEEKLKLQNDEKDSHDNETSDTFQIGNATNGQNYRKVSYRRDQEDYMHYLKNGQEETKVEGFKYGQNLNERTPDDQTRLQDAQTKLRDETIASWDQHGIDKMHTKDLKQIADHEETVANQLDYTNFQLDEERRKKEASDRNKQYQADLLAQIQAKKDRKDYY